MGSLNYRKQIFDWIEKSLNHLNSSGSEQKEQVALELLEAVQNQMQDLISINAEQTINLLKSRYSETYQEKLILNELSAIPKIQLEFLNKFLS